MMRPRLPYTPDLFDAIPPESRFFEKNRPLAGVDSSQLAIKSAANVNRGVDPAAAPSLFTHPRANRRARLGGTQVAYELRRSARRTIGFSIGQDGLLVSAPRWVPLAEIDAALQEKSRWIVRKLEQAEERLQRLEQSRIVWRDGVTLPYLGQPMTVVLSANQGAGRGAGRGAAAMLQGDAGVPQVSGDALRLRVALAPGAGAQQLRDTVLAWLMRQARRLFQERLDWFAPRLGVQWRRLVLSNAGTRWGSANANGGIRLNWRLIHFDLAVIDYVVVHELSHLRVMDHSPRFWALVESVLPDYAARKALLSEDALPRW
ncbi:MAG: Zinc metalloprotease [Burkholderiaceae bacterium]|jgi:predicted metal-dependent hydrolase|nr:MAG: Zinc metalloprotease [Burkholderiaceae bacterium]